MHTFNMSLEFGDGGVICSKNILMLTLKICNLACHVSLIIYKISQTYMKI